MQLVEENGEQFFAFNSLKDFDLYFKSLAHSNCLDEVFKAPKEDHDTQELKANLNFSGMLERKVPCFHVVDTYIVNSKAW